MSNKKKYGYIVMSDLKPISIWQIKFFLSKINKQINIVNISKPLPGYVRMVITTQIYNVLVSNARFHYTDFWH